MIDFHYISFMNRSSKKTLINRFQNIHHYCFHKDPLAAHGLNLIRNQNNRVFFDHFLVIF